MAGEAFVVTFREGVEAALIVGIMLAYLAKTGRETLKRLVYLGIIAGIAASLAEALVIQSLFSGAETAQQSIVSGIVMVVASFLVVTLIIWMMRTAKAIKKETESKIARYVERGSVFGIFLLSFAFIFREGSETVLFVFSLSLASNPVSQVGAGLLGLVFAALWGVLVAKGAVRIDLKKFFTLTSILIGLFVVELVASAIHEFQEARVLGAAGSGPLWDLQIWLVTDNAKLVTMLPIVILPLFLLLFSKTKEPGRIEARATEDIRAKATLVGIRLGAIAMTVTVLIVFMQAAAAVSPAYDPQPMMMSLENGKMTMNATALNLTDGMLHKFHTQVQGKDVRFLVVADLTGTLRVAFDACKVCGSMGFVQTGRDAVACKRCGVETSVEDIGVDISCHPIPLDSVQEGNLLTLSEASLAAGIGYF